MPHDHHDHDHDVPHSHTGMSPSGHPYRQDQDEPLTYWQNTEIAVRELLIEKGITTELEVMRQIDQMDSRSPADGAKVVARAWTDPDFKARLLADATEAIKEFGFEGNATGHLKAVENTDAQHNMVVCTLCSCYPWPVLGLPPVWYKSAPYRSRAVSEPRAVLGEFGVELPSTTRIRVWDSTAELRYLVIPMRPAGTEGWSEEKLARLVTRDSMIGTGLALDPAGVAA